MISVLSQIYIPLLSLIILTVGNGYFSTYLSYQMHLVGHSNFMVGAVSTGYYAGIVIGAFHGGKLISSAGHIRAYAAFASLVAAVTLCHSLIADPYAWILFRALGGYSMAALFIVIESWVLIKCTENTRGQVLSLYMVAIYGAQALGQSFMNIGQFDTAIPFIIVTMLTSISVVPLTLAKIEGPLFQEVPAIRLRQLYNVSPSGTMGCLIAGLILGAFYALMPVYLSNINLSVHDISLFMSAVIVGGMALQYPVGRASDYINRSIVTLAACIGLIICSIAIRLAPADHIALLLVLAFFWGGFAFAIYPLSISHACDMLESEKILEATQGLLLAYSVGATLSPTLAPAVTTHLLPQQFGLMIYLALLSAILIVFITYRQFIKPLVPLTEQDAFVTMPVTTTPIFNELDPRTEPTEAILEESEQGARE